MPRQELTPTMREHIAENMKERVYATITLLAVIAASWQHHTISVRGMVLTIAGTVVALWLATLVAMRMSHRAVHGKAITISEYRKHIFTSSGLLAPAIGPILLILGTMTGFYTMETALVGAMIVLLLSLFFLSFIAGRRIYDNLPRLLLISLLEMSVGVGVIVLKLTVGE